jgi:hypothetical protein
MKDARRIMKENSAEEDAALPWRDGNAPTALTTYGMRPAPTSDADCVFPSANRNGFPAGLVSVSLWPDCYSERILSHFRAVARLRRLKAKDSWSQWQ